MFASSLIRRSAVIQALVLLAVVLAPVLSGHSASATPTNDVDFAYFNNQGLNYQQASMKYATTAASSDFTFERNTPFTLEVMLKPRSLSLTNESNVLDFRTGPGADPQARFVIKSADGANTGSFGLYNPPSGFASTSAGVFNFNQWSHIAAVFDGNGGLSFYVNGVLSGSSTNWYPATKSNVRMYVGFDNDRFYDGWMNEVRVWNGVARTQAEILANMGNEIDPTSTGLVAYYRMDDKGGTSFWDETGRGNTATFTNAITFVTGETNVTDSDLPSPTTTTTEPPTTTTTIEPTTTTTTEPTTTTTEPTATTTTTTEAPTTTPTIDNDYAYFDNEGLGFTQQAATKYASTDASSDFTFERNTPFTLEVMLKPRSVFPDNESNVLDFRTGPGADPQARFVIKTADGGNTGSFSLWNPPNGDTASSAGVFNFNEWSHIAAVYDGNGGVSLYVNGVLSGSRSNWYPDTKTDVRLYVGFDNDRFYDGWMNEVRVWNGVARTQSEILANMGNEIDPTSTGLVAYYRMDDGSGTSFSDETGRGHTATFTNAITFVTDDTGLPEPTTTTTTEPPTTTTTTEPSTTTTEPSTTTTQPSTTTTQPSTTTTQPSTTTTEPSTTTTEPSTTVPAPAESVVLDLPQSPQPLLADTEIVVGEEVLLEYDGFVPGEYVQLIVASTPQVIASGYADSLGRIRLTGSLPSGLESGLHNLALFAPVSGRGVRQPITVEQFQLPATGMGGDLNAQLLVAVLVTAFGLLQFVSMKKRSRSC